MKTYPKIPNTSYSKFRNIPNAVIFDKLDGSNIRVEWHKKRLLHKYGTRHQLLDHSHPNLSGAINLFDKQWENVLAAIAKDERWMQFTAFFEFWGENSFVGLHEEDDEKHLTLIDIAPYKKGILGPHKFLKLFGHLEIPNVIDICDFNKEYARQVYNEEIENITFEGIVAKSGEGHDLVMAKAKTKGWIDKVRGQFLEEEIEEMLS